MEGRRRETGDCQGWWHQIATPGSTWESEQIDRTFEISLGQQVPGQAELPNETQLQQNKIKKKV